MPGTLFVVATPIGNLEDITLRALRTLRSVSVIAAEDTRRTANLLQRYEIPTPTVSFHEHNERARTAELMRRLEEGDSVAVVSDAGTPLISDPGARLVAAAVERGIRVEPIPGASAVLAALTAAGLATDRFTFLGFAPARRAERLRWLQSVRGLGGTLVYFESPNRIAASLEAVREILGERQIVLARELTKLHETFTRGWISEILARPLETRGEYTVLVSDQIQRSPMTASALTDTQIVETFGQITEFGGVSARDAVARIADEAGRPRQEIYAVLRKAGEIG